MTWTKCFNANYLFAVNVFALQDRTNNLFKQVYEQKSLKGRANDAIASACLYIACRQEGVPRTFKGQNKSPVKVAALCHVKDPCAE